MQCTAAAVVLLTLLTLCRADDAEASPALGVYVVTSEGEEYKERVRQARRTWAPLGSPAVFVAATADAELGVEALPCSDDEEGGVCCKTLLGLRLALERFPKSRWFARVVDDTYVFGEQLVEELRVFDATARVYVGPPSVTLHCHIRKFAGQCAELHAGGGGGVVFSRPLAEELLQHQEVFLAHCKHDDVFLGHFLRYVLGVHLHMLPGVLQEPRFVASSWNSAWRRPPRPCPLPLPPPVYARMLDWGQLTPFVPLDSRRLGLVHSDPSLWPTLALLPKAAADAIARGAAYNASLGREEKNASQGRISGLLVYASTGGRRVVSPHFRDADVMGVCVYRSTDLLASFGEATRPPPGVTMVM